jgi:hypothetical protein
LQDCGDLIESHIGVFQKLARDLVTNLISHLSEGKTFHTQMAVQSATVHRKEAGDCGGGTGTSEQLCAKNPAQIVGD